MGIERATVLLRMKKAFHTGQSASSFIKQMQAEGLAYRRTQMLSDWRSTNEVERKKDVLKYVRRDYMPTRQVIAEVDWELSKEYLYKLQVHSKLSPFQPVTTRFINIMSDKLLSKAQVEEIAFERYGTEKIERLQTVNVYRRVVE